MSFQCFFSFFVVEVLTRPEVEGGVLFLNGEPKFWDFWKKRGTCLEGTGLVGGRETGRQGRRQSGRREGEREGVREGEAGATAL